MSTPKNPRRPQIFKPDDPAVTPGENLFDHLESNVDPSDEFSSDDAMTEPLSHRHGVTAMKRRFRWGAIFLSATGSLLLLAASTWLMRFVAETVQGNDWISWLAFVLVCIAGVAALIIAIREIVGIMRLHRLHRFRRDVDIALAQRDVKAERNCVHRLKAIYRTRPDMSWSMQRLRAHENDIQDPGDLLLLAERDLILPLDERARVAITETAKRVSLVTALSPIALIDVAFVLAQNLSLLRQLSTLYGARPGFIGGLRLAKLVVTHIVATGGLALTDDLFGQVLGQDLIRRLSRRLGEGVFNGVLTARIGVAAIEVLRPLPYIDSKPVRLRELVPHIFRKADRIEPK